MESRRFHASYVIKDLGEDLAGFGLAVLVDELFSDTGHIALCGTIEVVQKL